MLDRVRLEALNHQTTSAFPDVVEVIVCAEQAGVQEAEDACLYSWMSVIVAALAVAAIAPVLCGIVQHCCKSSIKVMSSEAIIAHPR